MCIVKTLAAQSDGCLIWLARKAGARATAASSHQTHAIMMSVTLKLDSCFFTDKVKTPLATAPGIVNIGNPLVVALVGLEFKGLCSLTT